MKGAEIQILKGQVVHNAKAFDAVCVALDYVSHGLGGIEAPQLREKIKRLEAKIKEKEQEICKSKKSE